MKTRNRTLMSVFAVAVTVLVLWHTNQPPAPRTASWDDVRAEAQSGGYQLINTEGLWAHYQKNPGKLFLVDTRQAWEYRTGHLKGALNFPMEPTWLSRRQNRIPLKKFLGPDKTRDIVFY